MFAVYIIVQLPVSQVELINVELCDVPSVRTIRLFVRTLCRVQFYVCSILTSMYDVHRFHNIEYSEEAPTSACVGFNTT